MPRPFSWWKFYYTPDDHGCRPFRDHDLYLDFQSRPFRAVVDPIYRVFKSEMPLDCQLVLDAKKRPQMPNAPARVLLF